MDELATLVHELLALYEPDACFLLAEFAGDVQIIARSNTDAIDVARVLNAFGGGGHTKAAAALVQNERLDDVRSRLVRALEPHVIPAVRVREIMSMNVHTVEASTSIREAGQLMQRYGHEGFPVLSGNRLAGILTRRDVDRACTTASGRCPCAGSCTLGRCSFNPTILWTRCSVMIENDLGQVPVVDDGRPGHRHPHGSHLLWYPGQEPSQAHMVRRAMEDALPRGCTTSCSGPGRGQRSGVLALYRRGLCARPALGSPTLDLDPWWRRRHPHGAPTGGGPGQLPRAQPRALWYGQGHL